MTSFGVDLVVSLMETGLFMGEEGMGNVAYLNQQSAIHGGQPARTLQEALDATVNQLVIDIAMTEMVIAAAGVIAHYNPAIVNRLRGAPAGMHSDRLQRMVLSGVRPTRVGWARTRQSMNLSPARYQSRISGRPYQVTRPGVVEIEEFGVVPLNNPRAGRWFDSYVPQRNALIEAKSQGYEHFLDKQNPGQFQPYWLKAGGPRTLCEGIRDQMRFAAENGYGYEIHFESREFMTALMNWARTNGFADILERFHWTP